MKTKYKILISSILACLCLCSLTVKAQTNVPPPRFLSLDQFTNIFSAIPTATNYQDAVLSLDAGALFRHGNVENELQLDVNIHTNYVFSVGIENAPAGNVIDAIYGEGGYRLAYQSGEIGLKAIGRRNMFTDESLNVHPSWQFGVALQSSWYAITGGKLNPYTELRFLSPESMHLSTDKWQFEIVAGVKWLIPHM